MKCAGLPAESLFSRVARTTAGPREQRTPSALQSFKRMYLYPGITGETSHDWMQGRVRQDAEQTLGCCSPCRKPEPPQSNGWNAALLLFHKRIGSMTSEQVMSRVFGSDRPAFLAACLGSGSHQTVRAMLPFPFISGPITRRQHLKNRLEKLRRLRPSTDWKGFVRLQAESQVQKLEGHGRRWGERILPERPCHCGSFSRRDAVALHAEEERAGVLRKQNTALPEDCCRSGLGSSAGRAAAQQGLLPSPSRMPRY